MALIRFLEIFVTIVLVIFQDIHCDDTCTTSRGQPGNCVIINKCEDAIKQIKLLTSSNESSVKLQLRKENCGFVDNTPKVCCQLESSKYKHKNLDLLPEDCGLYEQQKLLGGIVAGLQEFPWNVLLSYQTKDGTQFQCGGSLINEKYVLTAAECINDDLVGVRVGEHKISSSTDCEFSEEFCSPPPQDITVESAIKHEQYLVNTRNNNIGLIRLKSALEFKPNVSPVCLPVDTVLLNSVLKNQALVVGWGATSRGVAQDTLLKIEQKILTNEECNTLYNGTLSDELNENKICTGVVGNNCPGDTGGPLIYFQSNERYAQVGVVNYKLDDCVLDRPGVYTRINKPVLDWILDHMTA